MGKISNKTGIIGTSEIVSETFAHIGKDNPGKLKPDYIQKNFSEITELLFYQAYKIYQLYEKNAFEKLKERIMANHKGEEFSKNDVKKILDEAILEASTFEKSLKQSRASRAGKTFENIVMQLLEMIGISNEHVTKEDKKSGLRPIDIVIPNIKTAVANPDQAHFLSLKTSLKDRWKLVVEDQAQGQRTHLLTLLQNEKLTKDVAEKIVKAGIFIYIPDSIKESQFPKEARIRKLSDLPSTIS